MTVNQIFSHGRPRCMEVNIIQNKHCLILSNPPRSWSEYSSIFLYDEIVIIGSWSTDNKRDEGKKMKHANIESQLQRLYDRIEDHLS